MYAPSPFKHHKTKLTRRPRLRRVPQRSSSGQRQMQSWRLWRLTSSGQRQQQQLQRRMRGGCGHTLLLHRLVLFEREEEGVRVLLSRGVWLLGAHWLLLKCSLAGGVPHEQRRR